MITKGLKVGDTFEDGGNTYKVLKVVGENYESQLVKTGSVDFFYETKEEVKEEVKTDLSSIPYAQLKKMCADNGLDAKGSKSELIARLEG